MTKLALQLHNIVVVLIFFVFMMNMQYVCGTNKTLGIYRGDHDIFDKPNCEETGGCSNCTAMNAFCNITDTDSRCHKCTCSGQYRTYLPHFGRCVKNDRLLLFLPVRPNSFLIQDSLKTVCITYSRSNLAVATCNSSDPSQQWIWTRHEQILHVNTLKCIHQGEEYPGLRHTWHIDLEECNTSETRQKWNCANLLVTKTFQSMRETRFMYLTSNNTETNIFAHVVASNNWKRYGEHDKNICSSPFGCYKFTKPSSAILVLDTKSQLRGQQQISGLSEREQCAVNYLQCWNNDRWERLEFTKNIFSITSTKDYKSLKWDLKRAPSNWSNLIIKVNFDCSGCVLIKLKYNPYPNYHTTASSKPPIPSPTESFTSTIQTSLPTPTTNEKSSTESFTGTLNPSPSSPTTNEKSPTSSHGKQQAESSNVVGIVVGVLVAILVVSGIILGFVCYKRRSRLDKTTSEVEIKGKEQLSKETQNPIYSSDEKSNDSFLNDSGVYQEPDGNMNAASRTCDVYEPVDDHKDEPQQGKKLASSLQEEPEYDYATNDEIRSAAPQRVPLKHINSSANSRENNEAENRNDNEEALYHTLEDDAGPVYQTLEDE